MEIADGGDLDAKINQAKWYKNFGAFALAVGTGLFSQKKEF